MWLVNTRTKQLEGFSQLEIPKYAILSHTWDDEEISFQEMNFPNKTTHLKKGYMKIKSVCKHARKDEFDFVWVDTCCIDKTSSAELSEAINSMFTWYAKAEKCYVYFSDLPSKDRSTSRMAQCRWFTRGWTLQEMLAPTSLEFYDTDWIYRGSKQDYLKLLSECTGISIKVLSGQRSLNECSVAMRMSWAANRKTSRIEDMAYCLLGIFDVNMPMLYGEGNKAFRRLQEEIVKRQSDLTIFAWDSPNSASPRSETMQMWAPSSAEFARRAKATPFADDFIDFAVTNKGIRVNGDVPLQVNKMTPRPDQASELTYMLLLGNSDTDSGFCGICLRKVGPRLFCRNGRYGLVDPDTGNARGDRMIPASNYYILDDTTDASFRASASFRENALFMPEEGEWSLTTVVPENLWDVKDRAFLRPTPYQDHNFSTVVAVEFERMLHKVQYYLIVLWDWDSKCPAPKVFSYASNGPLMNTLFDTRYRENSLPWSDLKMRMPEISQLTDCVQETIDKTQYKFSAAFQQYLFPFKDGTIEAYRLVITTTKYELYQGSDVAQDLVEITRSN